VDAVEDDFTGKDRATTLKLGDGSVNVQEAMSSRSYPRGTPITTIVGELALDMGLPVARVDKVDNPKIDWPSILQEAIRDKRVVEVEYVLPELSYRIKSFILPKGTEVIRVKNEKRWS